MSILWFLNMNSYKTLRLIYEHQTIILEKVNKIMTVMEDLNNAVATLQTNFTELDKRIQAEVAALTAALAAGDTTAVQAAVTNISAVSAAMAKDSAELPQP